jgi:hypothetical protein
LRWIKIKRKNLKALNGGCPFNSVDFVAADSTVVC